MADQHPYPHEVYEILRSLKAVQGVPPHLERWLSICVADKLVSSEDVLPPSYDIVSGTPTGIGYDITPWGEWTLKRYEEAESGPPKAVWLGSGRVRIGDQTIALEFQEGAVLEALVQLGAATRPDLEKKSGVDDAVGVLKKIREKFPDLAPCISLPGKRGKGGYATTIKPE